MEELDRYLVNIDFEQSLKSKTFSTPTWNKINRELEYLFFWQTPESGVLWTKEDFEDDYIDYIEGLTRVSPKWSSSGTPNKFWWGQLRSNEEFQLQRKINSKVEAVNVRKKLALELYESTVCHSIEELKDQVESINGDYVVKEEFAFSGLGLHFSDDMSVEAPIVVEPWMKRIRDFSLFERDGEVICIQSQVNHQGTYKGSLIKPHFSEKNELVEKFNLIKDYYTENYNGFELQLDCFQYLKDSALNFQFLGEVNHRRTLGVCFYDLHKSFGNKNSFLAVVPQYQLKTKSFSSLLSLIGKNQYNPVTKSGVICLTPSNRKINLFFITEESERTLQFLVRDFWKGAVKENFRLPPEFIVYL